MLNTGNKTYIQAFIEHFKEIKNKEKFREEFENIFGVKSEYRFLKSKEDNWEWWFKTIENDENIIAKLNSNNKIPKEWANISGKLQSCIYNYLRRNFNNPHLKISDNPSVPALVPETLKDYFKNHILPEIFHGDKTKHTQGYYNLAKNPVFINNYDATDDVTLTKMWNLYLNEMNQGNITDDKLVMHALSDILNHELEYTDQNNNIISLQCNKRSDFVIKNNNHNIHIKHLGHAFSSEESIKTFKKKSKYVVRELEIKSLGASIEDQIAEYIFSMKDKNDSLDRILKSKKTLVLFIKSDQIIDSEKLKDALKKMNDSKNQQSKPGKLTIEEVNQQAQEPLKITPQYQPAKNRIETSTSSVLKTPQVIKLEGGVTVDEDITLTPTPEPQQPVEPGSPEDSSHLHTTPEDNERDEAGFGETG